MTEVLYGKVLIDDEGILKQLQEWIEELYKGYDLDEDILKNLNSVEEGEIGPPILKEETYRTQERLKNHKDLRPDIFPEEMLKNFRFWED